MVNKEYLKEYYQKNKDLIKQRSRERYHRTKKLVDNPLKSNQYIKKHGPVNDFIVCGEFVKVFFSKGGFFIIDFKNIGFLFLGRWHKCSWGYASNSRLGLFHNLIFEKECELVDHINGNKLDNRFCNLRASNKSFNAMNQKSRKRTKTGINGISLNKRSGFYEAYICPNNKKKSLGSFKNLSEAICARENAFNELIEKNGS